MNRYTYGNRLQLLRNGAEYFPALEAAIEHAQQEIYLETYIFADDPTGQRIAEALIRAAHRGVVTRVLVDGWGAKNFLSEKLFNKLKQQGVQIAKYRPEIAPWQYRSHRLRRLHRKLVQIDGQIAFIGGINIIDDMHTPNHTPPRLDFAVKVEGPVLPYIVFTMKRVWALVQLIQFKQSDVSIFLDRKSGHIVGKQVAKFVIRDNLRNRRAIERAYLAAIRTAKQEIILAHAYFLPGIRFRRALIDAVQRGVSVILLLQGRVEYMLLHYAERALYGQLLRAGIEIHEYHKSFLHAKVAVIDKRWATVGSSNIDPFSLLMAREANLFVRDEAFAHELHEALRNMMQGARVVKHSDWAKRSRWHKLLVWLGYGLVRALMGFTGYGNVEWWKPKKRKKS